jgi:hypothetical protein
MRTGPCDLSQYESGILWDSCACNGGGFVAENVPTDPTMKKLFIALVATLAAHIAWAAGETTPPVMPPVKGEVLEVKDVDTYTYLRLKTAKGETWAAVNKAAVKKGAEVTINNPMVLQNFESKSLKRTFDTIVFGTLAGTASAGAAGAPMLSSADRRRL